MNSRDWDFAFGSLGDPLADIEHWMTPPYPKCMPRWDREGRLSMEDPDREYEDYRDSQREKGEPWL